MHGVNKTTTTIFYCSSSLFYCYYTYYSCTILFVFVCSTRGHMKNNWNNVYFYYYNLYYDYYSCKIYIYVIFSIELEVFKCSKNILNVYNSI